ncbi:MAG: SDR family NAD(P)-dependent oxidoreductase [Ilumatobacter sp.]|jgi:3alpha(or 20beta)-hydroxysteroid dehydrogenase|uniref:SDR family NAD(P)-dependent oxidoreductase n=1 Tax=Ilumatobacter sp. TaxID=1967498 RepID=UPI00391DDBB4
MTMSLDGAVAIVTGAARGMGAEHVRGLVAAGARVVATDILDEEGRALADDLGDAVMYRRLDVTDADAWDTVVAQAEEAWGPVKVLVNNAGIVMFGPIESLSPSDWQRAIDINLTGVFLGMHAVVPSMRRANGGAIVNISSTAGLQGYANLGAYVASKWGVRGLTKTAALELGPDNIRVNSIHPGPIRTPMIDGVSLDMVKSQPIPRVGEPEEVTAMLLFILQDATYSTGHEFIIDGGTIVGATVDVPDT